MMKNKLTFAKILSTLVLSAGCFAAIGFSSLNKTNKASASSNKTYILVGSHNGWNNSDTNYQLGWDGSQYAKEKVLLEAGGSFRIVESGGWTKDYGWNQCRNQGYFDNPNSDNNIKVRDTAFYSFYFKDWNDAGHDNPIYVSRKEAYTVTFLNEDGTDYDSCVVCEGDSASPSKGDPTKSGGSGNQEYHFAGWVDNNGQEVSLSNINSNLTVKASFELGFKSGRYIVGHFGNCDSFTTLSENSILMEPHNTNEMKALHVVLNKGESFKTAYYNGSSLESYIGHSSIEENCNAYKYFKNDSSDNIVCLASGSYSIYFKDSEYSAGKKISIAYDEKTASQLAWKLHDYDQYIVQEEAETPGGKGYCKNEDRWEKVIAFYNELSSDEKAVFQSYASESGYYKEAYDRFAAWAVANGYNPLTGQAIQSSRMFNADNGETSSTAFVLVAISAISLGTLGCILTFKKRREN